MPVVCHGLLVYNEESNDTDVDEEPLLGWIVATTPQTAAEEEHVVLLDYEDDMIITMLDHTLGCQMINVGQEIYAGDRFYKISQRLISISHIKGQPISVQRPSD